MSYFPVSCSLYYYLLLAFICALRVLMNTMWTRLASLLYPFSFLLSHYWCHNCPRQLWPNFPPYMPPPPLRWKFPVAPSPLHTSSSPLLGPGRQMIELTSPPPLSLHLLPFRTPPPSPLFASLSLFLGSPQLHLPWCLPYCITAIAFYVGQGISMSMRVTWKHKKK